MGWRTVVDVRDHSQARGSAYVVAVMLAERAPDETRVARPGIELLARDARVDKRTCQRALKRLESLGEIERLKEGHRGSAAEFYIRVGKGDNSSPYDNGERVTSDPNRAASDPERVTPVSPLPKGTKEDRKNDPEAEDRIYDFWLNATGRNGRTQFTALRRRKVRARRREFTDDEICRAITNCAASDFHVQNGHTDLELVCRSTEKLERFRDMSGGDADAEWDKVLT